MKKIILLGSAFLLTMNASFADCGCGVPSFSFTNEETAVSNFVANKFDNALVRNMTLTETLPFAVYNPMTDPMRGPRYYGPMRGTFGGMWGVEFERTGMTKCEVECANIENSVKKYDVEFLSGNKICSVNLKVTMMSKRNGFKSVVKQKLAPVCE
jgi:hypothetical protein